MSPATRSKLPAHPLLLLLMFGGMAWVGWFITKTVVLIPLGNYWAARDWQQVPCTVQKSWIGLPTTPKSDQNATRVEVIFTYSLGGKDYSSSRYDFLGVYSTGEREQKEAIVARHPPGTRTACWVNPEDHGEAVLNREFSETYLIGSLFSLFLFAGVWGMGWTLFQGLKLPEKRRRRKARRRESPEDTEPWKLKRRVPLLLTLIGGSVVAAIWNGGVWLLVSDLFEGWQEGRLMIGLTLITLLALMVGLLLIWATIAPILTMLTNPRLELTLSRKALKPGQSAILQWKLRGNAERVKRLRIVLEAPHLGFPREDPDSGTTLDSNVLTIFETDQPGLIAEGTARLEVPSWADDFFDEDQEQIVWPLRTYCEIQRWPDPVEEHAIFIQRRG